MTHLVAEQAVTHTVEAEGEPKLHEPLTGVMAVGELITADTWL